MNVAVNWGDFKPFNQWTPDTKGDVWLDGSPRYAIDHTTGRRYWNEGDFTVGFKCVLLTLGTPVIQSIALLINAAYRVSCLVSGYSFWKEPELGSATTLAARRLEVGKDVLRIMLAPLVLFLLEASAVYGIFSPYNGRKIYASLERAMYEGPVLAPCFQPDPSAHALGGNPDVRGAF